MSSEPLTTGKHLMIYVYVDEDESTQVVQEVVQLNNISRNIEDRIKELENRVRALELILLKEAVLEEYEFSGGPAGIRTPDLHLVRVAS